MVRYLSAISLALLLFAGAPAFAKKKPKLDAPVAGESWFSDRTDRTGLRRAGGEGTDEAVNRGLAWLAAHQDKQGYWDTDGFDRCCKVGKCGGMGTGYWDPGVTGLSLLAFLGAGHSPKSEEHGKAIRDGLVWLAVVQDETGRYGPPEPKRWIYNHTIATLAMVEAYGVTKEEHLKKSAQMGLDLLIKCENPYLAWRYGVRPGDNDTSVCTWALHTLASAREAGFKLTADPLEGARSWILKATDTETGRTGYASSKDRSSRDPGRRALFPPSRSEACTAMATWCRVLTCERPDRCKEIKRSVEVLRGSLPDWDVKKGKIDLIYWHFGTLAMFQVGGRDWKTWNEAMRPAVLDHQKTEGEEAGSWDPAGAWGLAGGRVYSTAINTLTLETYYRYPRLFGRR